MAQTRFPQTLATALLLTLTAGATIGLAAWKRHLHRAEAQAAQHQPEPAEVVEAARVATRKYARTTTAIGTARALRSITLRNELAGTVAKAELATGQVVEPGTLLVQLDVTVEEAELKALEAEARLAASMLSRMQKAMADQGASAADVDRARAEHDKTLANVARVKALIERKRLRAPFRARVGMVDLHKGQYLEAGTAVTTLQGVANAIHIDFAVTQEAASTLQTGTAVRVTFVGRNTPAVAKIVAIDARVEAATRSTWVRAELEGGVLPPPGASVRVQTPVEPLHDVLIVPVSSLRRGPAGDHVFVLANGKDGKLRATQRRVKGGAMLGDEIVIHSGLKEGEQVASTGSFKLREGVLVQLAPGGAPRNGSDGKSPK
ncbi:MAG: efflux RND transporter periplasmic adaptor subunit [Planctomycetes bacterium]|nr:efflux RND transporter periplasmic adaptor subunit [Planctomycetota bacterium]